MKEIIDTLSEKNENINFNEIAKIKDAILSLIETLQNVSKTEILVCFHQILILK